MDFQNIPLLIQQKPESWPPAPRVKKYPPPGGWPKGQEPEENEDTTELLYNRKKQGITFESVSGSSSSSDIDEGEIIDLKKRFQSLGTKTMKGTPVSRGGSKSVQLRAPTKSKIQAIKKSQKQGLLLSIDNIKKKKFSKAPPRMARLALWEYLRLWDISSQARRDSMIFKFLEDYVSVDPLDLDQLLSKSGSLIFTRFTVGMQLNFQRRKAVAHFFNALGIFIKSLQAERFTYEFQLMGGIITTFEVLRVDEMSYEDKMQVFHFLFQLIDGSFGSRVKQLICSDSSYLESIVDCLTMCKSESVINHARIFLETLCFGNLPRSLSMISKYVISLLPCDFNPKVQTMACRVLPIIIEQNDEIAQACYSLVVDVLKSDYDEALVDVGELCRVILETQTGDDLLVALIDAVLPGNTLNDLTTYQPEIYMGEFDEEGEPVGSLELPTQRAGATHDTYFRQQFGAIFVLSFLVKNKLEYADWMIEKGVIGALITALGTACYDRVQLEAIRLLLLLHELSPDCSIALSNILPRNLLVILLNEEEEVLQYLTAVMCVVLRRMGGIVYENWTEWLNIAALRGLNFEDELGHTGSASEVSNRSGSEFGLNSEQGPVFAEVTALYELLDKMLGDPMETIVEGIESITPDDKFFRGTLRKSIRERLSSRLIGRPEKFTLGEQAILEDEDLEPFRKYVNNEVIIVTEREDEFEKYYAAKFMGTEQNQYDMGGMEMAALRDAEKAMKFSDPFNIGEDGEQLGDDDTTEDNDDGTAVHTESKQIGGPGKQPQDITSQGLL